MNSSFSVAVHAAVYLNHRNCMLSSEELAGNICTNPARVRKVMSSLKKAGLVETKEGNEGGYRLVKEPKQLTLDLIARALEVRFVESNWHSGDTDMECLIASGMANLMDDVFDDLEQRCMARLKEISIDDLDKRIFQPQSPSNNGESVANLKKSENL